MAIRALSSVRRTPWHIFTETEPDHQIHAHLHMAAVASNEANDIGRRGARRHKINQRDGTVGGFKTGLENETVSTIVMARPLDLFRRSDPPMTVAFIAQEGCKAGVGIEARPAKPVERPRPVDERDGLAVADNSIVFDMAGQFGGTRQLSRKR